jgi:hypothetical protein
MVVIDALRDQQRSDTWYKDIINYLENRILPDASNKRRDILIISNFMLLIMEFYFICLLKTVERLKTLIYDYKFACRRSSLKLYYKRHIIRYLPEIIWEYTGH